MLRKKRILAFILVSTLVLSLEFISINNVSADALSDAQKKKEELEQQIKENNSQISNTQKEAYSYLDEIRQLDIDISEYSSNLSDLQNKVDEVNNKIKSYEDNLQNSAQRYNSAEDMYTTRLRAIYENGVPHLIDILFSSEGIDDFFSKLSVYQSIIEYDKSLVGNIQNEKEYIDNIKKDIEIQKTQLDQLKYDVEKSTNALNSAKSQKQNKVAELNKSKEKLEAVNSVLKEEQKQAEQQIAAEIAKAEEANKKNNNGTGGYPFNFNGVLVWPTESRVINCAYRGYEGHTGVDMKANRNKVFASAKGVVITAKKSNVGYGNHIIIAHGSIDGSGKNIYTLYGHLYSLNVSVGQTVEAGQVIGISGNSGNVYPRPTAANPLNGSHLHFEVRLSPGTYGCDVNPMKYLK